MCPGNLTWRDGRPRAWGGHLSTCRRCDWKCNWPMLHPPQATAGRLSRGWDWPGPESHQQQQHPQRLSHGRLVVAVVWRELGMISQPPPSPSVLYTVVPTPPPFSPRCLLPLPQNRPGQQRSIRAAAPGPCGPLALAIGAMLPCSTLHRRTPPGRVRIRSAMPVQGDMIVALGSNPVADAMGPVGRTATRAGITVTF